jgi:hypothetical protein
VQNAALTFNLSDGKVTVPPRDDVATIAHIPTRPDHADDGGPPRMNAFRRPIWADGRSGVI